MCVLIIIMMVNPVMFMSGFAFSTYYGFCCMMLFDINYSEFRLRKHRTNLHDFI